MEVTVTICDKEDCKKKNTTRNEAWAYTEGDPSGNGSNSWDYTFDLCPEHQKEWVRKGEGTTGPEAREILRKLKINYRVR
jgi:hypothetical protein